MEVELKLNLEHVVTHQEPVVVKIVLAAVRNLQLAMWPHLQMADGQPGVPGVPVV